MTKNIPILERCIRCPKCEKKTLRKSLNAKLRFGSEYGREYYCDQCHLYFGIQGLIDNWNYDAADLFDAHTVTADYSEQEKRIFSAGRRSTNKVPYPIIPKMRSIFVEDSTTIFNKDEPIWWTNKERQDAYEMVDRMFTNVPEWEEDGTTNKGIDIGIEGYPI